MWSRSSARARTDGAPAMWSHPSARARTDGAPAMWSRSSAKGRTDGAPAMWSRSSAKGRTDGAPGDVVPLVRKSAYGWGTRTRRGAERLEEAGAVGVRGDLVIDGESEC
jgi:hypothetical protein